MQINLSDWASLVQDVAASLQALPPRLSDCLDLGVLNLHHHLEAVTQVKFCHLCYHPETNCRCPGVPLSAPPTLWSQIMEQTPGYGTTASSSGVTTLSTSLGGMSGLVPPPPGISIWDPFQWKASISQQPVTTPSYRPPTGRTKWLKAALSMKGLVPQAPQMAPAIHQLSLLPRSQPATPYQQLVQPPSKTSGLGVTFDSSATKPTPTDSWDTGVHGRQANQGRDDGRRPVSHPRGEREGSSIKKTNKPMPRQEGGRPAGVPRNIPPSSTSGIKRASPKNPLENIANYRSAGWRKDLGHILRSFYKYYYPSHKEAEWNKLKAKFCPEEEWRRDRPTKHHQSSPRRWKAHSTNPFPLQDSEGRHKAVQQLYQHSGECTLAQHNVAAQGMASHHPDLELGTAKSLNNQVLCMILEYHLMCLSQGPSYISPVLPEAAKDLLPSMEEYLAGSDFQRTQDMRVLERAKILRVAVWLHRLDMATTGDGEASYSLEVTQHGRGPLVEFLLAPQASSLMFEEVVDWVLVENRYKIESLLDHVREL